MINTSIHRAIFFASLAGASVLVASPAFPQPPTDAQRAAIRSECRSDYAAHCASIPPGGVESLQCLQKNMSSLSSGCQGAVRAIEAMAESKAEPAPPAASPAAEPKTETKPAAAAAPADAPSAAPKAASPAAKAPSSAQAGAIRSACRSDYPKVCAGVPTGGVQALQCLEKNKSKVSAACQKAVAGAGGGAVTPATGGAAAADTAPAAASPPTLVLRPMLPREELFVLRSCGPDARALCAGVQPGGGRIMQCLAVQSGSLSPACRSVLDEFAAR
jgi:hypothetical protein